MGLLTLSQLKSQSEKREWGSKWFKRQCNVMRMGALEVGENTSLWPSIWLLILRAYIYINTHIAAKRFWQLLGPYRSSCGALVCSAVSLAFRSRWCYVCLYTGGTLKWSLIKSQWKQGTHQGAGGHGNKAGLSAQCRSYLESWMAWSLQRGHSLEQDHNQLIIKFTWLTTGLKSGHAAFPLKLPPKF